MRRLIAPLVLALATGGCNELISPPRSEFYEYRLFEPRIEGGTDTLAFRWPRQDLPVRFWVAPGSLLRPHLETAITRWEEAFLYGEWRGTIVADSAQADILVFNEAPRPKATATMRRVEALAPECRGAYDFTTNDDSSILIRPLQLYVYPRFGPDAPGLETCYRLTMTHEVGHSLGIFAHSLAPDDVMYVDPTRDGLSSRDRATAEILYHLPATIQPGPR